MMDSIYGLEPAKVLNIYIPLEKQNAPFPIMIWIHGGAFIFGGVAIYDPSYIMEEDVVLVTIQYRLNIFGFMSTEDSEAPGNYGNSCFHLKPFNFFAFFCPEKQI